jgi:hypothetical protein
MRCEILYFIGWQFSKRKILGVFEQKFNHSEQISLNMNEHKVTFATVDK